MNIKQVNLIEESDFSKFVQETYGRPYCFQQQDGCRSRGVFWITVPSKYAEQAEKEMNDCDFEDTVRDTSGVKFNIWLKQEVRPDIYEPEIWNERKKWHRNFYPNIDTLLNDMHSKGLIEAGSYVINIDW